MSDDNTLRLVQPDDDGAVRLSELAATRMADLIDSLRRENDRLRGQNDMLDKANALVTQDNERLRKQVEVLQIEARSLKGRLAAIRWTRTPEDNESLADQIESHRNNE